MAKTKEELNALKEVETLNKKLAELNEEELEQVTGGTEMYDQGVEWMKKELQQDAGSYEIAL